MKDIISELCTKIDEADILGFFEQIDSLRDKLEIEIKSGYATQLSELRKIYIAGKGDHNYADRLKLLVKTAIVVVKTTEALDTGNGTQKKITYEIDTLNDEVPLFDKPDSPSIKIKMSVPRFFHADDSITQTINNSIINEVLSVSSLLNMGNKLVLNSDDSLIDNMHRFKQQICEASYFPQRQYFNKEHAFLSNWEYEYHIEMVFSSAQILSILTYEWFFSMSGAHPVSYRRVYSFDLTNGGKIIRLSDFIRQTKLPGLSRVVTKNFYNQLEMIPLNSGEEKEGIDLQKHYRDPVFFLKNNGLYFVFSPYIISAYIFGAQAIYVSFQEVAPYLHEFLPPSLDDIFNP